AAREGGAGPQQRGAVGGQKERSEEWPGDDFGRGEGEHRRRTREADERRRRRVEPCGGLDPHVAPAHIEAAVDLAEDVHERALAQARGAVRPRSSSRAAHSVRAAGTSAARPTAPPVAAVMRVSIALTSEVVVATSVGRAPFVTGSVGTRTSTSA